MGSVRNALRGASLGWVTSVEPTACGDDGRDTRLIPRQIAPSLQDLQAPVGGLVDDLAGRKVVLADLAATAEVFVFLDHAHPAPASPDEVGVVMRRREPAPSGRLAATRSGDRQLF
jgi:hypothetical protein